MSEFSFPDEVITTLQESSYDDTNDEILIKSNLSVVKIDDYNEDYYTKELNQTKHLRGGDAYFEKNNKMYIIEFKNQPKKNIKSKAYKIVEKMYGSSVVLMDKLNLTINQFRNRAIFILVYSVEKELKRDSIAKNVRKLGTYKKGELNNSFGLKKLENYLYKEVIVFSDKEFEDYLKEEKII